jgi:hypothetical protein
VPDHPQQAGRDQRRVEDDGGAHDVLRGTCVQQGAAEIGAEQRQHDHPVERDQQAARRRIVDRDDAAFRHGGPQEGAKQQIEGAPVEQRLEDLLAEQVADALAVADAGQHDPAGDEQRHQGDDVEQQGCPEGAERRTADQAVDGPDPGAAQRQARDGLGRQAGDHDAQQQQDRAAIDDIGQLHEMPAQPRDLMDGEIHPLGQDLEEGAVGGIGRLGRGREGPFADEPADHCRDTKSRPFHALAPIRRPAKPKRNREAPPSSRSLGSVLI